MVKAQAMTLEARREAWRAGKPIEDPEKTKRWGFVTAKPSEFLVHVRRGRVLENSSGQGASCFKWPWDAVAIIPTSLQRLQFRADQVTAEKVGVEVVGLAVYRIAEPLLAYRVLNFSFPERAQEKLEEALGGMFVGATRRLVANLSIAECLQKRKSALADELLREIAPVVGGSGRPDDGTDRGWGVVIDTIEIQEVKILSDKVFAALQAPFRAEIDQRAQDARIRAEMAVRERRAEASRSAREEEARDVLRSIEIDRQKEEQRIAFDLALKTKQAESVLAVQELELARRAHEAELARTSAAIDDELQRIAAETRRVVGEADTEVLRKKVEVERIAAEARARVLLAEKLPELAAAIGQRIAEVRVQQIGGDPLSMMTQGLRSLVAMVKDEIS